jgi:hypothetical protein
MMTGRAPGSSRARASPQSAAAKAPSEAGDSGASAISARPRRAPGNQAAQAAILGRADRRLGLRPAGLRVEQGGSSAAAGARGETDGSTIRLGQRADALTFAHELVHVAQIRRFGCGPAPVSARADAAETEARRLAPDLLRGEGPLAVRERPAARWSRDDPAVFLPLRERAVCFDEARPWIVHAEPGIDDSSISLELYGIDISSAAGGGMAGQPVIQGMLQPHQQAQFRQQMQTLVDADLQRLKDVLLHSDTSAADREVIMAILRKWSDARDYIDAEGRSYFDALLDGLDEGTIVTTHSRYVPLTGIEWETGRSERSYLDKLYEVAGFDVGKVIALIGSSSSSHGGYLSPRAQFERVQQGGTAGPQAPHGASDELIERSSDFVAEGFLGLHSGISRDILTGLRPADAARVLDVSMQRHDERNWIGLGRFGEPTPQHMLHHIFENLNDEDREEVLEALESSGVFSAETAGVLRQGRTLAGKYLPYTTYLGEQAAQFYADEYVRTDNELYLVGGLFASLWTPETATATVTTLATAGFGAGLAKGPVWLQRTMLVAGTGPAAFATTQAVVELATGEDIYSGRELSSDELLVRGILAVSNAIMLGAGFHGARSLARVESAALGPSTTAIEPVGPRSMGPELPGPAGGGAGGRGGPRVVDIDSAGNAHVVAQDPITGEFAYLRINMQTGNGVGLVPGEGPIQVVAGRPVPNRPALPAAEPAPVAAAGETQVRVIGPQEGGRPLAPGRLEEAVPFAAAAGEPALLPGRNMLMLPEGTAAPRVVVPEESFAGMLEGAGMAGSGVTWRVMPEGVVVPEHPFGMGTSDIPIYFEAPMPQGIDFGQVALPGTAPVRPQVLSGPLPEGLPPHEIFMPRPQVRLTADTIAQMRRTPSGVSRPGAARGERLELFLEQGMGPGAWRHGGGLRTPMTQEMRFPDVRQPMFGRVIAYEGKNYGAWRSPAGGGPAQAREVPLSSDLQQQITNDAFLMHYGREPYQPVWFFGDAPPSAALVTALEEAGIPYIVYGDRLVP